MVLCCSHRPSPSSPGAEVETPTYKVTGGLSGEGQGGDFFENELIYKDRSKPLKLRVCLCWRLLLLEVKNISYCKWKELMVTEKFILSLQETRYYTQLQTV